VAMMMLKYILKQSFPNNQNFVLLININI